ncbi:MAG: sugar phosphate isomerase/epimerase family protein [Candidatus Thorarchaeota archaeon]
MSIYLSTLNFMTREQRKISEIVPIMLDAGITNIEISSGHPYEAGLEEKIIDWCSKAKLLFHNYAPPSENNILLNLSSRIPSVREMTSDFVKERILLCKKLGIDYYSFHAGFCVEYEFGKTAYSDIMPRREGLDIFIREIREIAAFAKINKIHIGIENHVSRPDTQNLLMLDDIDDFDYLFNQLDSNHIHLHLDVGHLNISSNTRGFSKQEFIKKFSDKIIAAHVHDNDCLSDEHNPITNDSWFLTKLQELNNLKHIILETKTKGNHELMDNMIDLLSAFIK